MRGDMGSGEVLVLGRILRGVAGEGRVGIIDGAWMG